MQYRTSNTKKAARRSVRLSAAATDDMGQQHGGIRSKAFAHRDSCSCTVTVMITMHDSQLYDVIFLQGNLGSLAKPLKQLFLQFPGKFVTLRIPTMTTGTILNCN